MKNLLDFIDINSFDERMVWRIPYKSPARVCEVEWIRQERLRWRYKESESLFWSQVPQRQLEECLAKEGVDLEAFQHKLTRTIMQQIVCAFNVYTNGIALFGEEKVKNSIAETQRFARDLEELLLEITENSANERPRESTYRPPFDPKMGLRIIK